jgi:hypothetical protein
VAIRGRLSLALGFALLACRTPTQVTIDIESELRARSDSSIAVQLDAEGSVESAAPRTVVRTWPDDGNVGSVAVLPSGSETFVARVVLATGRDPASCSASDARGCIVVRRRLRFQDGEALRARVVVRAACAGVYCDASTSCGRDGTCGPIDGDVGGGDAGTPPPVVADAGDPYANAILADRPRHYYRFDEPDGVDVAKDLMGRADGRYERGVRRGVTGALATSANAGVYFDGVDGAIVVDHPDDLPGAASFEAWIRSDAPLGVKAPTVLERIDTVTGGSFGYRLSKPEGTTCAFELFRGPDRAIADVRAFKFAGYMHVAAVARGGKIEIYVDGGLGDTGTFEDKPIGPVLAPLLVGASRAGAGNWRGSIDELAIYDYPLSAEQIRAHRTAAGEP